MTEDQESGKTGMIDLESKFWRTTLLVISVILVFAGPTYVPYLLNGILNLDYVVSIIVGIVFLAAGLLLMAYLIRKKVIL